MRDTARELVAASAGDDPNDLFANVDVDEEEDTEEANVQSEQDPMTQKVKNEGHETSIQVMSASESKPVTES